MRAPAPLHAARLPPPRKQLQQVCLVPQVHAPQVHVPEVHAPEVHVPEVHVPEVHVPQVHVPKYGILSA